MRIFVYEYTCAAGGPLARELREEGAAMLSAVLDDLERSPGIEAVALLGEHGALPGNHDVLRVRAHDEEAHFRALARDADYTLVIAPECADVLRIRSLWVEECGGRLLGSTPEAVRLSGDKLALSRHLRAAGVPTPATVEAEHVGLTPRRLPSSDQASAEDWFPAVYKPRQGAGAQATFLVRDFEALAKSAEQARVEGWEKEMLLQEFVPGRPASVAVLAGPRQQLALMPASQDLSADGRFRYLGGTVPLPVELRERASGLALRALAAVSGLSGYVGVDLVLGQDPGGSQDQVIEINPRLTTSYVGLRRLARSNLAQTMLRLATGAVLPPVLWRPGTVRFQANGIMQA